MGLDDMARRARDREHPPSEERLRAQRKQQERGNAPVHTRLGAEERIDGPWNVLTGLRYRAMLAKKLKQTQLESAEEEAR